MRTRNNAERGNSPDDKQFKERQEMSVGGGVYFSGTSDAIICVVNDNRCLVCLASSLFGVLLAR